MNKCNSVHNSNPGNQVRFLAREPFQFINILIGGTMGIDFQIRLLGQGIVPFFQTAEVVKSLHV